MAIKTTLNYSPNFNPTKRNKKKIKFIIFHYTGMKKESDAIKRLTQIQSQVSCHYMIKNNGEIINMVPESYVAWHAGKSSWKNYKSLNKNSIGIEISNPGHRFKYKKFTKKQINALLKLSKYLIKKYKIKRNNILGHSDISPDRKKDPGEKFPWKYISKKKIGVWHTLKEETLKKFRNYRVNNESQKFFFHNLKSIGYDKKFYINTAKENKQGFLIKAFQRRYRQKLINGKIDGECLLISQNLIRKIS
jgi:N-acetylmuramoyl-L-alanine amidase